MITIYGESNAHNSYTYNYLERFINVYPQNYTYYTYIYIYAIIILYCKDTNYFSRE